ncbi:MAG: YraN family protein [Spirochaetaceae bacterium]|jgi:putative endonuclease|nr:YraN family protein [Spirochaetaceae bacterium]
MGVKADYPCHLTGREGESCAAEYLEKLGYEVLFRNWRKRGGEIDIIALNNETLVFAEVKTWPHGKFEDLERVMGYVKRKRIMETAKCFLYMYRQYKSSYIRFDVLLVDFSCFRESTSAAGGRVHHIINAFSE